MQSRVRWQHLLGFVPRGGASIGGNCGTCCAFWQVWQENLMKIKPRLYLNRIFLKEKKATWTHLYLLPPLAASSSRISTCSWRVNCFNFRGFFEPSSSFRGSFIGACTSDFRLVFMFSNPSSFSTSAREYWGISRVAATSELNLFLYLYFVFRLSLIWCFYFVFEQCCLLQRSFLLPWYLSQSRKGKTKKQGGKMPTAITTHYLVIFGKYLKCEANSKTFCNTWVSWWLGIVAKKLNWLPKPTSRAEDPRSMLDLRSGTNIQIHVWLPGISAISIAAC